MARKHTTKRFIEGGFYHLFNSGISQTDVFLDEQDYETFLLGLKRYLSPVENEVTPGFKKPKPSIQAHRKSMNLSGQVDLLAYCLMPNHFHLLVRQNSLQGITQLMRRVCTNYVMYFNRKYNRQGPLFSSIYKAVLIQTDDELLHVSRFIHLNPVTRSVYTLGPVRTTSATNPASYPYSSYKYYCLLPAPNWINNMLIDKISGRKYNQFVDDFSIRTETIYPDLLLDVK